MASVTEFEIVTGTPELELGDVAHLVIPGRGRDRTGNGLSPQSYARVVHAVAVYRHCNLAERGGLIVCSGYKTPSDVNGAPWSPEDAPDETFVGVPEADSMRRELVARNIPAEAIRVERHSVDTVTNFARIEHERHLDDGRPVAIVAQASHLARILEIVAPRTLRRAYLGIVVPEQAPMDVDGRFSRLVSRVVLLGVDSTAPGLVERSERRVARIWKTANSIRKFSGRPPYRTGGE